MYQFFVEEEQIGREFATITGTDVNHIKNVLRMKPGEKIRVSSRSGGDYLCEITELGETFVQADLLKEDAPSTELPGKIYLFQGIPKGERMETVIEKAVELGVYEIIPVAMKYCVVKLDAKREANRLKRWQKLSETAAKQSKRSLIPNIHPVMALKRRYAMRLPQMCACCPMRMQKGWKQPEGRSLRSGQAIPSAYSSGRKAVLRKKRLRWQKIRCR